MMNRERYKALVTFLDNEMSRFWVRFNIFSAIEVGALVGIFSNNDAWSQNSSVALLITAMMLSFSIVGVIVIYRGNDLQRSMVMSLIEVEAEEAGNLQKPSFSQVKDKMKAPLFTANIACLFFSIAASLIWVALTVQIVKGISQQGSS